MEPRQITTGGEFPSRDQLTGMGELAFLFMRAPNYAKASGAAIRAAIEPAVDTGHFALMRNEGVPRALITWAFLDAEAEARFLSGAVLTAHDWISGDRLWLMDVIAPYGQGSARRMIRFFESGLKAEITQYRFIRASRRPGEVRVYTAKRLPTGRFGSQVQYQHNGAVRGNLD